MSVASRCKVISISKWISFSTSSRWVNIDQRINEQRVHFRGSGCSFESERKIEKPFHLCLYMMVAFAPWNIHSTSICTKDSHELFIKKDTLRRQVNWRWEIHSATRWRSYSLFSSWQHLSTSPSPRTRRLARRWPKHRNAATKFEPSTLACVRSSITTAPCSWPSRNSVSRHLKLSPNSRWVNPVIPCADRF